MSTQRKVSGRMRAQEGVVSYGQAREAGVQAHTMSRRVQSGFWERPLRGVYVESGRELGGEGRLRAYLLGLGPDVAANARSAMAVHGFGPHPPRPELVLSSRRRFRRPLDAVVVRRSDLHESDVVVRRGMPTVSVERMLVELVGVLSDEEHEDLLDRALRERRTTWRRLHECASRLRRRGFRGPGLVLKHLEARDPAAAPTESVLEDRWLRVVAGLEGVTWQRQATFRDDAGARLARVDFRCVEYPIVVETDGWATHGTKRAFERDAARRTAMAASGTTVLVFTWHDVTRNAASVRARVRAAVRLHRDRSDRPGRPAGPR